MNISSFWVYGYLLHNIGTCRYSTENRQSFFEINGKIYPSPYMSMPDLWRDLDHKYDSVWEIGQLAGECMLFCRIPAEVNRLNFVPAETLAPLRSELKGIAEKLGKDLEPDLFFMTLVE